MKISNFRLAECFLRKFCSTNNLNFTDLNVEFNDIPTPLLQDGTIVLSSNSKNTLSKTLFQLISTYIDNVELISSSKIAIPNDKKVSFLNAALSVLRDMSYGSEKADNADSSLNRFPIVWLLMRDIICPVFERGIRNIDILVQNTPYVDGARFFNKDQMPGINKPTIVLNSDVKNRSFALAFLLVEAISAHNLCPIHVMHNIATKSELRERFFGSIELASFSKPDTDKFLSVLTSLTHIDIAEDANVKTAQTIGQTWWYVGLIEKMLEPARGSDNTITEEMADATKELWDKVEAKKQQLGLNQLSMESLLRIQSEEYQNKPNLILQGLLSDVRVW